MSATKEALVTDEMIQKAQKGSLRVTEASAIAMAGELYTRGKYRQAENACRQIIAHKPTISDAHNILGVSLNAQGKVDEGIAAIREAIRISPRIASYYANLGEVQRLAKQLDDAQVTLEKAVKLDASNAQAANNLGIVYYEQKEFDKAIEMYRRAIGLKHDFPEAHNNLGNSLRAAGEPEAAIDAYQTALAQREVYPEAYNNLGTLLREQGKPDQAQHALRKALQQKPDYVEAHNNLAALLYSEKQEVEALRQLTDVLRIAPNNTRSLLLTARIQLRRANHSPVEKACRLVLQNEPDNSEAYTILGQLMHDLDKYEQAIVFLEKALELKPENAEARNFYGVALKSVGRLDEARDNILKSIEENEQMYAAYSNLNDLVDYAKEPDLFERIERVMAEAEKDDGDRVLPLHFAYGKALDDRGEHEKALEHYVEGGKLKRKTLNYSEERIARFFDGIKAQFPAEIFRDRPFEGLDSQRPVFIVGMPRSGSTLCEQIVSSHPDVFGAGEVKAWSKSVQSLRDRFPVMPNYPEMVGAMNDVHFRLIGETYLNAVGVHAGEAKRVTDKLLTNYFFVGLINLVFPHAKIINTLRNPVDTCLSAFTKLFKDDMPHSYDMGELGRYYRRYEALMAHWRDVLPEGVMMTVRYEDTVDKTEQVARELIEFIGLPWDDACLAFHESSRPVKTASVAQIRKPIYTSSVERWRKYGKGMQPLLDALEYEG